MTYTCPVCGYGMPYAPEDNNICSSCGTEFGYDDVRRSHSEIARKWIASGAKWFSSYVARPAHWNPWEQMIGAGLSYELPYIQNIKVTVPEEFILVGADLFPAAWNMPVAAMVEELR